MRLTGSLVVVGALAMGATAIHYQASAGWSLVAAVLYSAGMWLLIQGARRCK
jgi:pyruvate/2-oxoacid:ferredoxin oxidoreductase alpha subunit